MIASGHTNKIFVKQHSLHQSEDKIIQVNNFEQDLIDLGFQTGNIIFVPHHESQKNLSQTIVVKDNKNKPIHITLNAATFKKVKIYIQNNSQQLVSQQQAQLKQNILCKICLDNDQISNLIQPCNCKGSVQYVHEDCLKTWLLKHNNIDDIQYNRAICELCKTHYKSELTFENKYVFSQLLRVPQNQKCCLFGFFLISLILYAMGILLATILQKNNDYFVAIIIGIILSFFIALIIQLLLISMFVEIISVTKVASWKILNNQQRISISQVKQKSIKKSMSEPVLTKKEDFVIKTLMKQQTNLAQI